MVVGSRCCANRNGLSCNRLAIFDCPSSMVFFVRNSLKYYYRQAGPKVLLNHVLLIQIPNFRYSFHLWRYKMYSKLLPRYLDLKARVKLENKFKSTTPWKEYRKKMYEKDSELVVKTEWLRMKQWPMFSSNLALTLVEPTVFHAIFALVTLFWLLAFCFMKVKSEEYRALKKKIIGYEKWNRIQSYLNCQNLVEQTHMYVPCGTRSLVYCCAV